MYFERSMASVFPSFILSEHSATLKTSTDDTAYGRLVRSLTDAFPSHYPRPSNAMGPLPATNRNTMLHIAAYERDTLELFDDDLIIRYIRETADYVFETFFGHWQRSDDFQTSCVLSRTFISITEALKFTDNFGISVIEAVVMSNNGKMLSAINYWMHQIGSGSAVGEWLSFIDETLHHVASLNYTNLIRTIVSSIGADVNGRVELNETPLNSAASFDHLEAVEVLLSLGANPNAGAPHCEGSGLTALHISSGRHNPAITKLLLDAGADANMATLQGITPLHQLLNHDVYFTSPATEAEVEQFEVDLIHCIQILIDAGANVNAEDNKEDYKKWTPLHYAARSNYAKAIPILAAVKGGVNINAACEYLGLTPLHVAASRGHTKTIKALIAAGADPHVKSAVIANASGSEEMQNGSQTPLHLSVQACVDMDAIMALIDAGADVNAVDCNGTPVLQHAAYCGHEDAVKALIALGADVNSLNDFGETVMHAAMAYGTADMINNLLDAGAKVNPVCNINRTPLDDALANNNTAAAKALVAVNAVRGGRKRSRSATEL